MNFGPRRERKKALFLMVFDDFDGFLILIEKTYEGKDFDCFDGFDGFSLISFDFLLIFLLFFDFSMSFFDFGWFFLWI